VAHLERSAKKARMTPKKKFLSAAVVALCAFIVLRLAVLPAQLNSTPYRDERLGEDLLRLFFFRVPFWVPVMSVVVFSVVFLLLRRKDSSHGASAASE
jgi:hypothetical protein